MKVSKYFKISVIVLVLSMIVSFALPLDNMTAFAAASVRISEKNITLDVGQSKTLQIIGAKKAGTWSSSDKSVAEVNKKGKVTAIKAGKAKITVSISNKKLTCMVTVKEVIKENTFITKAPFDAVEAKTGKFKYVIPKNWSVSESDNKSAYLVPASSTGKDDCSSVNIDMDYTGKKVTNYDGLKDYMDQNMQKDQLTASLTKDLISSGVIAEGTQITYTDYKTSEFKVSLGTTYKIEFTMSYNGITRSEAFYFLAVNNYIISVNTDDIEDNETPDAKTVGEYIMNSLQLD